MTPFIVQISSYIIFFLLRLFKIHKYSSFRFLLRAESICIGLLFLTAGIGHFTLMDPMAQMFPEFVPMQKAIVIISGIFEIILGLALIYGTDYDRKIGMILLVFLVLALPLNIFSAVNNTGLGAKGINYLWFRVPLQIFWFLWILKLIVLKKKSDS